MYTASMCSTRSYSLIYTDHTTELVQPGKTVVACCLSGWNGLNKSITLISKIILLETLIEYQM